MNAEIIEFENNYLVLREPPELGFAFLSKRIGWRLVAKEVSVEALNGLPEQSLSHENGA